MISRPNIKVHDYFEQQASGYQAASTRLPWRVFREREAKAVCRAVGDVAGCSLLDLGSGSGYYLRLFASHHADPVVGVDASAMMVAQLPEGVEGVVGDVTTVSLKKSFERIVCAGVMEFVEQPEAVLENARRHANPGTVMGVLVPLNSFFGRLYRLYHHHHQIYVRLFTPAKFSKMATQAGWIVEWAGPIFPFSLVARLTVNN